MTNFLNAPVLPGSMKIDEIVERIFHVQFRSQQSMARTFLRFQEHYENPELRGKMFTHEEFKRWYVKNSKQGKKTGRFTYYKDWEGFNIPGYILNPFYNGKFDPLTRQEERLLDAFKEMRGRRFYIIGTKEGDDLAIRHEVAHGLFYTSPSYRREATLALNGFTKWDCRKIDNFLDGCGSYHPSVWIDETHAYALADAGSLKKAGVNKHRLLRVQKHLQSIFKKYCQL